MSEVTHHQSDPTGYESRLFVPELLKPWDVEFPGYLPADYTSEAVLVNGLKAGWADPTDPHQVDFTNRPSFEGPLQFDTNGRPLNPRGRQGLAGRGLLGKWGVNNAADPVVIASGPNGSKQILLIQRHDTGQWALPGGMVDPGEHVSLTAARELQEEAGIDLREAPSTVIYQGHVDDPRNTDNSWMETTACLLEVDYTPEPTAGDDASQAQWFALTNPTELAAQTGGIYASHSQIIMSALASLR